MNVKQSKLIVGLGNPGKNYEWTRHNLGFLVLDRLVSDSKVKYKSCSFTSALVAEDKTKNVYFLKPMTFMNHSGMAIRAFCEYYKIPVDQILVLCDDLTLDFKMLRIKTQGSPGGHNGLKSIVEHLGTQDFSRLRMGISHPGEKAQVIDYVLEEFDKEERKSLNQFIDEAAECCFQWLNAGITQAMNRHNRRKESSIWLKQQY